MTRRNVSGIALLTAAVGFALSMPAAVAQPANDAPLVRIGMVKTFFNDVPKALVDIVTSPFGDLMKATTGLDGKLDIGEDTFKVAQQLDEGKLQLGVFHGHEFAWAQKKHPKLVPLMVVVNHHHDVRSFIIVHKNSPAKSLADLRGKNMDIPTLTKQQCRVHLEKHCTDNAQNDPKAFFASIKKSANPFEGLDEVSNGKSDAVVVDTITLEYYKEVKQFVYKKNLRILQQSEPFPSAVIAYKQGALDSETIAKIHGGLQKANTNEIGRDLMKLWNIAAFEPVPNSYTQSLADVLKAYPSPEPARVGMR